jgi:hypothetical protein
MFWTWIKTKQTKSTLLSNESQRSLLNRHILFAPNCDTKKIHNYYRNKKKLSFLKRMLHAHGWDTERELHLCPTNLPLACVKNPVHSRGMGPEEHMQSLLHRKRKIITEDRMIQVS